MQASSAGRFAVKSGKTAEAAKTVNQFLTFHLGKDLYAVGILAIKEILQYGQITEVPLMPPWLRGVINLRGAVVPVVDLAFKLGKALTMETKRTCIVILEIHSGTQVLNLGVMVDAVSAVLDIDSGQIEPAPTLGSELETGFIAGIGKLESGFVIILNVGHIFSGGELQALAAMKGAS